MSTRRAFLATAVSGAAAVAGSRLVAFAETPRVRVERVPEGGLQPQALIDGRGVIHLVYLKGAPAACDVMYVRREPGQSGWSNPLRVNSEPRSAVAMGTIRGAQIALGKGDRLHVVWNGSSETAKGSSRGSALLYTRQDDARTGFEPQRDALGSTAGLDGGASIAADAKGNVYLAWHAAPRPNAGEGNRRLWVARSTDEGKTFAPEAGVFDDPTGACGCCSVKAFTDRSGRVYLLYRAATEMVNRDMVLLAGEAGGPVRGGRIDPWVINACPMSSESFTEAADAVWAAWETNGQVRLARVDPKSGRLSSAPVSAPGGAAGRKHPFLAANKAGYVLVVWDEGTAWQRGGSLVWQLFDAKGAPLAEKGRVADGIPVWGLATAVALPDGGFLILH